ncbi:MULTISPECIES: hypothetical protein [Mycolicibacterium]|nr:MULTISPECIES: hypothetical protein [Mycolicibacterium]
MMSPREFPIQSRDRKVKPDGYRVGDVGAQGRLATLSTKAMAKR